MEDSKKKLKSSEVGAFVAQWAERHPVSLEELVQILDVPDHELESLKRQASGRLAMERWMQQNKPATAKTKPKFKLLIVSIPTLVILIFVLVMVQRSRTQSDGPVVTNSATRFHFPVAAPSAMEQITTSSPSLYEFKNSPTNPQNPAVGLGTQAGADLAKETMQGAPSGQSIHSVNMEPSHQVAFMGSVPRPVSGVGYQSDPGMRQLPPTVDLTKRLNSARMPMPYDLQITVVTPKFTYQAYGPMTHDPQKAAKVDRVALAKELDRMIQLILERELTPEIPDSGPMAAWTNVQLRIGRAVTHAPLHWIKADRKRIQNYFKDPNDPMLSPLFEPLLETVQSAGSSLFGHGRMK